MCVYVETVQKQISVEMGNFMPEIFARLLDRLDIIQLRFAAIERTLQHR